MFFRIFDSYTIVPISWLSWDLTDINQYMFYFFLEYLIAGIIVPNILAIMGSNKSKKV